VSVIDSGVVVVVVMVDVVGVVAMVAVLMDRCMGRKP